MSYDCKESSLKCQQRRLSPFIHPFRARNGVSPIATEKSDSSACLDWLKMPTTDAGKALQIPTTFASGVVTCIRLRFRDPNWCAYEARQPLHYKTNTTTTGVSKKVGCASHHRACADKNCPSQSIIRSPLEQPTPTALV